MTVDVMVPSQESAANLPLGLWLDPISTLPSATGMGYQHAARPDTRRELVGGQSPGTQFLSADGLIESRMTSPISGLWATNRGHDCRGYSCSPSLRLADQDRYWVTIAPLSFPLQAPTPLRVVKPAKKDGPPAYRAFKELVRWLETDEASIARASGIGRTTPASWARAGHDPRPSTVRKLYELHNLVSAIRGRLGGAGARAWLEEGSPSRRDALLEGKVELLQDAVHEALFKRPDLSSNLKWKPEDSDGQAEDVTRPIAAISQRSSRPRRTKSSR